MNIKFNPLSTSISPSTVGVHIYVWVEQSLYFIGYHNSVAYQAVSRTLPKGCSIGFVPWFLVLYFPGKKKIHQYTKTGTPRSK